MVENMEPRCIELPAKWADEAIKKIEVNRALQHLPNVTGASTLHFASCNPVALDFLRGEIHDLTVQFDCRSNCQVDSQHFKLLAA